MSTEKLRLCPFCGEEEVEIQQSIMYPTGMWFVKCHECGVFGYFNTREQARIGWNRRAGEEVTEKWDAFKSYVDIKTQQEILNVKIAVLEGRFEAMEEDFDMSPLLKRVDKLEAQQ